jgi:putative DNA modification/repair radical SAM protein
MRRAHDPSCLRRRGPRLRRYPQQQCSDAGGLRSQSELAAGDEIELTRLPPYFQHHGAERIAGQRVGGGAQRGVGVSGAHGHHETGIETQFAKPAHRQRAGFEFRKILPYPDQRPARCDPPREAGDEAGGRRALMSLGEHFMHRRHRKPTPQHSIRCRMSERDLGEVMRIAMRLQALDAPSQTRKRACVCGAHAPLLGNFGLAASSPVNPRLAHLFMICSNIKLTGHAESIGFDTRAIHERNQRDSTMDVQRKLEILADAAKYDASCASSGTEKRDSSDGKGLGSTAPGMGICHSYAPDGRCISLLKVLLTNACNYDCLYCVNRTSSNVPRARFTVDEVVKLTIDFYRRNYIEGLFLSSGIIRSADYTMEQVVSVARKLREEHHFRGYIHLKTIPEADDALIAEAGKYADRLSINIEMPLEKSLAKFAPEKDVRAIRRTMGRLRLKLDEAKENVRTATKAKPPRFAPAGQSTQMIIGADAASDKTILDTSANLYGSYRLKRVYYSAFSPIPDASRALPLVSPPLIREHRLYQADWLMRFYGFDANEIVDEAAGMLPLDIDPKLAWALRHRERFPLDVATASRQELLRVPGFGTKAVDRIIATRRLTSIRVADLARLHVPQKKALPFIVLSDHRPSPHLLDGAGLAERFKPKAAQLGFGF